MKTLVRNVTIADAPALLPLLSELVFAGNAETIASRLRLLLPDESKLHSVAIRNDEGVLGFLSAESRLFAQSGAFCELVALAVVPTARRAGIARALVGHAEEWASARGLSVMRVRSSVARVESHQFYRALGFDLLKTQHCYVRPCKPNNVP
jgi:GNAT superfamily N-acetyltransferase